MIRRITIIILALLASCGGHPNNTMRYMGTIGHEVMHCFFGEWHGPDGKYPSSIDHTTQLTEISTISIKFLTNAELQALYREKVRTAGNRVPDRNVDEVKGFNLRYVSSHACDIYIAII